jgi:hypothetical protein
MIHKRMYFGISMSLRRNRRTLVVCYWISVIFLLTCATAVYLRDPFLLTQWWMLMILGGLFGTMLAFLGGGGQL